MDATVTIRQMQEELDEKEQIICDLEKQAISEWKKGDALTSLVEKYALLSGLSEEEVRYILFECHGDEDEEVETLNESHYVYDARVRAIVYHTPEAEPKVVEITPQQTIPAHLLNDMDEKSNKLFEYQRLIKKLTFENKNMQNALEEHNIQLVGLDSFEKVELDKLYNQFWSDKSDLITEITDLRRRNAALQDQIDHLPTEARLYRESVMKSRNRSVDQDDDSAVATYSARPMSPEQLTGVGARVARLSVVEEPESQKRIQDLERRLEETKKQLTEKNEEFRAMCTTLEQGQSADSMEELNRMVRELTTMKETLEKENQEKAKEIEEIRASMAQKEEQLNEKKEEARIARELADKKMEDYNQACANVEKKEGEIEALKAELAAKTAELNACATTESSSSDSDEEKEELRNQVKRERRGVEREMRREAEVIQGVGGGAVGQE